MLATRGVMWANAILAPKVQLSSESARAHKYKIGDIIEEENRTIQIVYVSPEIDCDNNWVYLCREDCLDSDGAQGVKYYIMQESAE